MTAIWKVHCTVVACVL